MSERGVLLGGEDHLFAIGQFGRVAVLASHVLGRLPGGKLRLTQVTEITSQSNSLTCTGTTPTFAIVKHDFTWTARHGLISECSDCLGEQTPTNLGTPHSENLWLWTFSCIIHCPSLLCTKKRSKCNKSH